MDLLPKLLKKPLSSFGKDFAQEVIKEFESETTLSSTNKLQTLLDIYKKELATKARKSKLKKARKYLEQAEIQVMTMANLRHKKVYSDGSQPRQKTEFQKPFQKGEVAKLLEEAKNERITQVVNEITNQIISSYRGSDKSAEKLLSQNRDVVLAFVEQYIQYVLKPEPRGTFSDMVTTPKGPFRVRKKMNPETRNEVRDWFTYGFQQGRDRIDILLNIAHMKIGILHVGFHSGHSDSIYNLTAAHAEKLSHDIRTEVERLRKAAA